MVFFERRSFFEGTSKTFRKKNVYNKIPSKKTRKQNVSNKIPSKFSPSLPSSIEQDSETKADKFENGGEKVEVAVQGRGGGEAPSEEEARQV